MAGLVSDKKIEIKEERITQAQLDAFSAAVGSKFPGVFPPSFPTKFRASEWKWLEVLEADMHNLLHTEQEYEYYEPLIDGDEPVVSSEIKNDRERAGMRFIAVETRVTCQGKVKIVGHTTFVVKTSKKETP